MTDLIQRLRAAAQDPSSPNHCEVRKLTATQAADEIERLQAENEMLSREAYTWWSALSGATAEIERLWAELAKARALATCGCGDGFTAHDPGTCGNCRAGETARKFAGWFREEPSGMSYRIWEQGGHEQRPGDVALYE